MPRTAWLVSEIIGVSDRAIGDFRRIEELILSKMLGIFDGMVEN
ncbi:MAG TPA: hypothetical protein VJC16_07140 [Candidatus Nanoarchaeia archaeon]|nr:hypothetical protein [Candidatus Nanoarchaeia archaeon]